MCRSWVALAVTGVLLGGCADPWLDRVGEAPDAIQPTRDPEARVRWMLGEVSRLKTDIDAARQGGATPEQTERIRTQKARLERAGVDWPSFLDLRREKVDFHAEAWAQASTVLLARLFNPVRRLERLGGALPAEPVLPDGGVPDSSFYVNTDIAYFTPDRIRQENADITPHPPIAFTGAKTSGTAEGFFGKDARGVGYIFVFDPPYNPEMTTSAEYIGSTLHRLAGYRVPKTAVCTIQGTGRADLDGRRAVGTILVPGYKGNWRFGHFERRRELRGMKLFAGWVHNIDQLNHNAAIGIDRDTGLAIHWVFDFGASLGGYTYRHKFPWLGYTHAFDWPYLFKWPAVQLGLASYPFGATRQEKPFSPAVGYFDESYDPEAWRGLYPNRTFKDMLEADARWAARKIARFSPAQVRTVVELARYTHKEDEHEVIRQLLYRRDIILNRYLGPEADGDGKSPGPSTP